MSDKIKISVVLPERLQKEMREKIISSGYSLRGKSEWIVQAIEAFLSMANYPELVKLGDQFSGFNKVETISATRELKKKLNSAVIEIRKKYPFLEGVQSRIIRSSILQGILQL